jgi:CRISPR-associated endonuclease/helicase Cas3
MKGTPTDFWGKLEKDDDGTVIAWHPVVDHCADVAAVCHVLLTLPTWRGRLARLAGRAELDDVTCARLVALAGLHDIGKYNLGFQAKGRPTLGKSERGHVGEGLGALQRTGVIEALDAQTLNSWGSALESLLTASICHHGRPVISSPSDNQEDWWTPTQGLHPVDGLRDLHARIRTWVPLAFGAGPALPTATAFSHAFAGLVMLADWLGSDTRFFPFSEQKHDTLDARFRASCMQAARALEAIGLDVHVLQQTPLSRTPFASVSAFEPKAAQQTVTELPLPAPGTVVVLESETGSGKTEAALAYFIKLFAAGLVDGLYFALPTRTAATQIHERVTRAIKRAFGEAAPPVVLAVPGYLRVDDSTGQRLPEFKVLWPDFKRERERHRGWAAENPKRYLASGIAVGTVDQVLLSSLQVGHAHLRATSLLRHLLVVDEVHASDAYMNAVLAEVLRFHRAAGGHALLLSATLGACARAELVGAPNQVPLEVSLSAAYPLVTAASQAQSAVAFPVEHDGARKVVRLSAMPTLEEPVAIATAALDAAAMGACAIVLRNTVADCVETQRALEQLAAKRHQEALLFRCDNVPAPHHARFARDDRQKLDGAIEHAFGKGRATGKGCVVVATQTIQQSLDLDADVLFTDLCPIDVLLQRIGRLHRHTRARPSGFEAPHTNVIVPAVRDLGRLIDSKGRGKHHHGLGSVYDDVRVLEAAWRLIEQRSVWSIPDDCRALVEGGVHPEVLQTIVDELSGVWLEHHNHVLGAVLAHRRVASLNTVERTRPYADGPFPDDRKIKSRLGEGDRIVEFSSPPMGPFGALVRRLTIRAAWAGGVADDELEAKNVERHGDVVRFDFGPRHFRYSRLGLELHKQTEPEDDDA